MNNLHFIQGLKLELQAYLYVIINCLYLLSPLPTTASPNQLRTQLTPYTINDEGYLHYNLQVNDSIYLAVALNLHNLFPGTNVENFRMKRYELTNSELKINSYQGASISVHYQIADNELKISKTNNLPPQFKLDKHLFSLGFIRELERLFAANDLTQLQQLNWGAIPKENILLFLSQENDFSSTSEFGHNAIHNILATKNYAVAKFFFNLFLTKNRDFNDFELLKTAIEQDDLDFIKKTSLNSLHLLGMDEVRFDYSFTQCTLLGKAILQKNKAVARYLLDSGASTDKVYQYESEVYTAAQLAEKVKEKRLFDLFK